MQGLIEFTLSTGYIIGPAVGGGLNEVRMLECMYAYAWLAIIVRAMCACDFRTIINYNFRLSLLLDA